jgi:aminopeptidase N
MAMFIKGTYLYNYDLFTLHYINNDQIDGSKKVTIRVYAQKNKMNRLDLAMSSIKMAMKCDEDDFGLYYDLNIYNIVCLDDFNAGAMENKSLNIFNSKYVLSCPNTSSDIDQEIITGVIGHE